MMRLKSSSQSGNLIQQEYKSSYGKRNLISEILPNSHFEDLGAGNLSVTVFWYFQNGKHHFTKQKQHQYLSGICFTMAVVFLPTGVAAISGIRPDR